MWWSKKYITDVSLSSAKENIIEEPGAHKETVVKEPEAPKTENIKVGKLTLEILVDKEEQIYTRTFIGEAEYCLQLACFNNDSPWIVRNARRKLDNWINSEGIFKFINDNDTIGVIASSIKYIRIINEDVDYKVEAECKEK